MVIDGCWPARGLRPWRRLVATALIRGRDTVLGIHTNDHRPFPALRAFSVRPGLTRSQLGESLPLPAADTPLVGRDEALADVGKLLRADWSTRPVGDHRSDASN
jgi:hypothetical protein